MLLGESACIQRLRAEIDLAARFHSRVVLSGETGSGKEVVAREIHERSDRARSRMVSVNCTSLPETLLEPELFGYVRGSFTGAYHDSPGLLRLAHHGTLLLDEVGDMSPRMQMVLLRFLESGEVQSVGCHRPPAVVDVRVVAASHRNLSEQVAAGAFRQDLYFRLNVIQLRVPSLREHAEDIPLLLHHFLRIASEPDHLPIPQLTDEAMRVLLAYSWPGNIRELRNLANRLVASVPAQPVGPGDLPPEMRGDAPERVVRQGPTGERGLGVDDPGDKLQSCATELWDRIQNGESFWTVVYDRFNRHDMTRAELVRFIQHGLERADGSYRALLQILNLPGSDYKRLHGFLYHHNCNLPVRGYRMPVLKAPLDRPLRGRLTNAKVAS